MAKSKMKTVKIIGGITAFILLLFLYLERQT